MSSYGGNYGRSLQATPTWAVAVVCFVLVGISLVIEQMFHHFGSWLKDKRKPTLYEALEKIKAELMLLGFISLLLVVGQEPLSEICIPRNIGHSWHPCNYESTSSRYKDPCEPKGMVQFISSYGIHQLHIFIFILAITHILYCIIILTLGRLKMRKWRFWEDETRTIQYQYYNDPERFRFARDTSFGRRHLHFWSTSPVLLWTVCFFRQFFTSVEKVDYVTLRHGFITAHLAPHTRENFNFQKYIQRSLEEDFKVVVGISPVIWLFSILFLLSNTNGWYSHLWLPFIPLIIILLIGAKLQVIITKMGRRILERGDIIKGTPVVEPGDDLFWFKRPGLFLFLIHLVLFTNAFQLAFFVWSWYEFGYPSCYHENLEDMVIRVTMGALVQVLCSYVTLPLYALVTQMGTSMKPTIFSDQVASALRGWHKKAKKHLKHGEKSRNTTPFSSRPGTPLHSSLSPVYLLRGQQNYHESVESGRQLSPRTSNFSNEGWGDGEGRSISPRHHEIKISNHEIVMDDSTRNVAFYQGEIERDIEAPSPRRESQHQGHDSISDFSFGEKQSSR